jgi:hypothetical protein
MPRFYSNILQIEWDKGEIDVAERSEKPQQLHKRTLGLMHGPTHTLFETCIFVKED